MVFVSSGRETGEEFFDVKNVSLYDDLMWEAAVFIENNPQMHERDVASEEVLDYPEEVLD